MKCFSVKKKGYVDKFKRLKVNILILNSLFFMCIILIKLLKIVVFTFKTFINKSALVIE